MADKNSFPQIPSTVWWGVRNILQRAPSTTIDERLLSVQLAVQDAASRQYILELKRAKILSEDNKATALAQKWRLDETYVEAVDEIIAAIYPEGLLDVAPPGEADRQKVVSWFLHEGLGQGAAGNKAATYLLLSSREPNEAPGRAVATKKPDTGKQPRGTSVSKPKTISAASQRAASPSPRSYSESYPLNINVQIHISADAGTDQIESIFAAMRRYLHDDPTR